MIRTGVEIGITSFEQMLTESDNHQIENQKVFGLHSSNKKFCSALKMSKSIP